VLVAAEAGRRHVRLGARGQLVLEESFQHLDRGVERPAGRSVLLLAVPSAVGHLLAEEPFHDAVDVVAEIGPERNDPAVDAGLDLAPEERLAVVFPPAVLADEAYRVAGLRARRVDSEVLEKLQAPARRGPLREERALPLGRQRLPPLGGPVRRERRGAAIPLPVRPLK